MSVFSIVKEKASALQVAQMYGLKVNPKGMACCPFHTDRTPSMKVDGRYYCFGCGVTGDAVDLAAQLLGLAPRDAALRIADDFGIEISTKEAIRKKRKVKTLMQPRVDPQKEAAEWISKSVKMLLDYKWKLARWKEKYAPKSMEEEWHPLFCEALDKKEWIEYLLDELLFCGKDQFTEMKIQHGKEVRSIECYLEQLLEREREYNQRYPVTYDNHREGADKTDDQQLSSGLGEGSTVKGSLPVEQTDREDRPCKRSWMAER